MTTSYVLIAIGQLIMFISVFWLGFLLGGKIERSASLQAFANKINSGELMTRHVYESLLRLNQSNVIEELAQPSPPPRIGECGYHINGPIYCNLKAGHQEREGVGHNRVRPAGTVIQ